MSTKIDVRCCKCNSKLFEFIYLDKLESNFYILIKCRKCKFINKYDASYLLNLNNKK